MANLSLDNEIAYDALSYAWDPPKDSKRVFFPNSYLLIRENLHWALVHLRDPTYPRYLWINALCINQSDNDEESAQIQRMRSIYARASRIVIWLGLPMSNSDLGIDVVNNKDLFRPLYDTGEENVFNFGNRIEIHNMGLTQRESIALFKLVERSWWTRIWSLQEVAVSKQDPIITCGNKSAPWGAFATITKQAAEAEASLPFGLWQGATIQKLRNTCDFVLIREQMQENALTMSLGALLRRTVDLNSTDPRDKIYALLGLAHAGHLDPLLPDYSKSPKHIFIETMRHVLLDERRLDSLSFIPISKRPKAKPSEGLPSWVTDWTIQSTQTQPLWHPGLYNAAKENPARIIPSEDPDTLCQEGLHLDTVSIGSDVIMTKINWHNQSDIAELIKAIERLDEMLKQIVKELSTSINPVTDPDVWQRTQSLDPDPHISDVNLDR